MSGLRSHMNTHSDEQIYKCSICNQSFKQYNTLYRHKYGHSEKRSYKCPRAQCDKTFSRSDNLLSHILRKHDDLEQQF